MFWFLFGLILGIPLWGGGAFLLAIKVPGVFAWLKARVEARIARL